MSLFHLYFILFKCRLKGIMDKSTFPSIVIKTKVTSEKLGHCNIVRPNQYLTFKSNKLANDNKVFFINFYGEGGSVV